MIELIKFESDDIQRLISWIPDCKFLLQWAGPKYSYPLDEAQLLATLDKTRGDRPSHFMYKANLGRTTIGHIELLSADYDAGVVILGRILIGDKENRRKGLGLEMIQTALKIAFAELGFSLVDLGVFKFNSGAIRLYEGLGFIPYRTIQNMEDENWTLIRMNLSIEDWKRQGPQRTSKKNREVFPK
mgnify:CR=1 FL=1|jgi:RimJ/RimL family protein N-acetyltransferase